MKEFYTSFIASPSNLIYFILLLMFVFSSNGARVRRIDLISKELMHARDVEGTLCKILLPVDWDELLLSQRMTEHKSEIFWSCAMMRK